MSWPQVSPTPRTGLDRVITPLKLLRALSASGFVACVAAGKYSEKNSMLWGVGSILFGGCCLMSSAVVYLLLSVSEPPENCPSYYLSSPDHAAKNKLEKREVVAFVGDSLTHGKISPSFVDRVQSTIIDVPGSFRIVNAGQNGACSETVLTARVDEALLCDPDWVCLMIGTNDMKVRLQALAPPPSRPSSPSITSRLLTRSSLLLPGPRSRAVARSEHPRLPSKPTLVP